MDKMNKKDKRNLRKDKNLIKELYSIIVKIKLYT